MYNNTTFNDSIGDPDHVVYLQIPYVKNLFMTTYIILFICCICGNVATLLVLLLHRNMRTNTNFFLGNLAAADLFVGIFCIVQNMLFVFSTSWPLETVLCKLHMFTLRLGPFVSAGILVLLSVERYIAILYPVHARHWLTLTRLFVSTGIVWFLAIGNALPFLFDATVIEYKYDGDKIWKTCISTELSTNGRNALTVVSFVLWYLIPLCVLLAIYIMISKVLWLSVQADGVLGSSSLRYSSASKTVELEPLHGERSMASSNANSPRSSARLTDSLSKKKPRKDENDGVLGQRLKVIKMLIIVIAAFAIATLPYHVRQLYNITNNSFNCMSDSCAVVQPITYLALFFNSAINPFLYAFLSIRFRKAFKELICCSRVILPRRGSTFTTSRYRTSFNNTEMVVVRENPGAMTRADV